MSNSGNASYIQARIRADEALDLLTRARTADLMARADAIRRARHGRRAYFAHSLNINPTNVCENRCELCAYWREPDAADAYIVTLDEARERLRAAGGRGLTDLHIVGGLNERLNLAYYETLLGECRRLVPEALVQGMTAVEIDYLARLENLPLTDVLRRLKDAGLGAIPGGGAEIFAPDVRGRICSRKISADCWLAVHEQAHATGLGTNATMLFGHVEGPSDVVDHLQRLRDLQDRTGGFQAFIALPFHREGTRVPVGRGPGGHTVVRTVALARIFLDNFPHIRVLANYMDPKLLHVAAFAGADDLGGTSLDERIAKAAGAPADNCSVSVGRMGELLADLGLEMVLVNSAYESGKRGLAPQRSGGACTHFPDSYAPVAGIRKRGRKRGLAPSAVPVPFCVPFYERPSSALARAESGERLSPADAVGLFDSVPFQRLGALAHARRLAAAPADRATFVIDRNISLTNVCESGCRFCAFHVAPGAEGAFTLSIGEVVDKVNEAIAQGATQVLVQGGLNPELDLAFYERMVAAIKACGEICVHSLSPTEVHYLAHRAGLSVRDTLERLRAAGLDSLPGGGGEILVPEVRRRVSPRKIGADAWLGVMETAHGLGMATTATMVYGLDETSGQLVEHLVRIRGLQDRTGGFTAFIPWSFQPAHTQMPLPPRTGVDYLRVVAISRLVLDNVPHIQAGWVTEGPDLAQLALSFGADDFGGVLMEERVVRAAGASYTIAVDQVVSLIREAGFTPVQRTTQYETVRVFE